MTAGELASIRHGLGVTQQALAEALGVHRVSVARWETGAVPITARTAIAVRLIEAKTVGDRKPTRERRRT